MRGEVITLDVETTGLDFVTDKIIEIGIILAKDDEILEQYQTFVNPEMAIPSKITAITGITDDDVRGAPPIHKVIPAIKAFIGDRPIIGHKIDFDLGMLEKYGVGIINPAIDTYELASVLLPTAPRYNLNSLVEQLGLSLDNAHRALDDTIAAWRVYRRLWEMLLELDMNVLREIVDHSKGLNWNAAPAFIEALRLRAEQGEAPTGIASFPNVFYPEGGNGERLRRSKDLKAIDVDAVCQVMEPGGTMQKKMPQYESRDSQVKMLRRVAEALNAGEHIMVEAPTGTGKSLAYLLPAAVWAMTNNERVVISTHTINLQDQLMTKDIPLLRDQLGMDVNAAVMKGRGNYLCPRRLNTLRRRNPTNVDEMRVLAKVLVWLSQGGAGTSDDLNLRGGAERAMWYRMTAQDEGCTRDRCEGQMKGTCPFHKARRRAEQSHLLIVNHALLLSDVAVGNRVLPEYNYLVMDEAHHLEDSITDGLAMQIDKYGLLRKLADLGDQKKGLMGDLLESLQDIPTEHYQKVKDYVDLVVDALKMMGDEVRVFFDGAADALINNKGERTDYLQQVRITDQVRDRRSWSEIRQRWEYLSEYTESLSTSMRKLAGFLLKLDHFADKIEDYENLVSSVDTASTYMATVHNLFEEFVMSPQANMIYWIEITTDSRQVAFRAAPLHVGELVQQHLWEAKESVILTSATLRTADNFNYIMDRLGAHEVSVASLPSPFDYEKSTLVYLPTDVPEPNRRKEYQHAVERGIIELASATEGRMLCLFTSYQQLRETASAVAPRLALGDIIVYDQTSGSSRQVLLDSFKSTRRAVLMGTRSFWEGVDIPGDDLSVVMIVRLPFSVPTDPIFAARAEEYGDRSFGEYSVPDAILRFRQGFGRLIRRKDDRGVVVIMDSRVTSKGYGRLFMQSLPRTTVRRGQLRDLPRLAKQWLDTDGG